ncbi:MAG: thioesterase family protein [Syntrophobacteraceae bacterium]
MPDPPSKKIITRGPASDVAATSYHITRVRVPLFEVDLGQAVYHGNYFHLFETGREDFLRKIGFPYREFMDRKLHLTIVESVCVYRKPLHYDDEIYIHTGIAWIRRRSLGFSQLIFRCGEGGEKELCTRADLTMVCVRFTGQAVVLPDDFRGIVEGLEEKSGSGD